MKPKKPRILLVGAGKFGEKHLNALLSLEKRGILSLAGIVVRSPASAEQLRKKYSGRFPIHAGFNENLLHNVDAVDIVTPPQTHAELIMECLPKVHVLVEKPMAMDTGEADKIMRLSAKSAKTIMVGHIFRYHPVLNELKSLLSKMRRRPHTIEASFINPASTDPGHDPELEMLHPFDMIDYLFGRTPKEKHVENRERYKIVSLIYSDKMRAVLKLGWIGDEKKRSFMLLFNDQHISCDIDKNEITIHKDGLIVRKIDCRRGESPLEREIADFIKMINRRESGNNDRRDYPGVSVGSRIVEIATRGGKKPFPTTIKDNRKRVAVIGAGIFGANCAIELAPFCDVTLFEKNKDILSEASFINQYRHHWGYHYPRSQETVNDIRAAIGDFEKRYDESIIREFPTYYSVAKEGSKVTSKQYLKFCDFNDLPYEIVEPPDDYFNKDKIDICLKTFEPIYDFKKLKDTTSALIRKNKVDLRLNSEVSGARIDKDGRKILNIRKGKKIREEGFDYVINATYARYNNFCKWLGLPRKPIRLDLVEALWVKLDIPKISLAVMDGKFTNMVPTGVDNIFTLVHIKESPLRRFVPKDGLVPKDIWESTKRSRVKKIMKKSMEWFPVLKKAKLVKVHYVLRGVNARREHDDARTSDIAEHGFGCFSILGGKLINSVSIAKEMVPMIAGKPAKS